MKYDAPFILAVIALLLAVASFKYGINTLAPATILLAVAVMIR